MAALRPGAAFAHCWIATLQPGLTASPSTWMFTRRSLFSFFSSDSSRSPHGEEALSDLMQVQWLDAAQMFNIVSGE